MEAAETGNAEIVRLLLEAGADPWIKGVENKTAYDLVAKRKGREAVAKLLSDWMQRHPSKASSPFSSKALDLKTPFASWAEAVQRLEEITSAQPSPHPQAKAITRLPLSLSVATSMTGQEADGKSRQKPLEAYRKAVNLVQTLSGQLDATWFLQFEPVQGAFLCGFPKADKWKVLGAFKTACANFGVTHSALLKFLKSLDAEQPFDLVECDSISVGACFRGRLDQPDQVARTLVGFCPFVAEDEGGSVKRFAKALAKTRHFKIWWD